MRALVTPVAQAWAAREDYPPVMGQEEGAWGAVGVTNQAAHTSSCQIVTVRGQGNRQGWWGFVEARPPTS